MAQPEGNFLRRLKAKTKWLRREVFVLMLALGHKETPWYAKAVAVCVVAYALSPVDLIPDPVPVLGYLDDVILVPMGVMLVRRMIPERVMEECRAKAEAGVQVPLGYKVAGLVIIGGVWVLCVAGMVALVLHYFK